MSEVNRETYSYVRAAREVEVGSRLRDFLSRIELISGSIFEPDGYSYLTENYHPGDKAIAPGFDPPQSIRALPSAPMYDGSTLRLTHFEQRADSDQVKILFDALEEAHDPRKMSGRLTGTKVAARYKHDNEELAVDKSYNVKIDKFVKFSVDEKPECGDQYALRIDTSDRQSRETAKGASELRNYVTQLDRCIANRAPFSPIPISGLRPGLEIPIMRVPADASEVDKRELEQRANYQLRDNIVVTLRGVRWALKL